MKWCKQHDMIVALSSVSTYCSIIRKQHWKSRDSILERWKPIYLKNIQCLTCNNPPRTTLEYQLFASSSTPILLQHCWSEHSHLLFSSSNQLFSPRTFGSYQQVFSDMLNPLAAVATNDETNTLPLWKMQYHMTKKKKKN